MTEPQSITRRRFLKHSLIGGVVAAAVTGGYSYLVEPYWYEIEKKSIRLKRKFLNLPKFTILHFSDLHFGFPLKERHLASITRDILYLSPDMICFTGDLSDHPSSPIDKLIPYLSKMKAPLGKYAVLGNHDAGHKQTEEVYDQSGFQLLNNRHVTRKLNGERIIIAGVEDLLTGQPDMGTSLAGASTDAFTVVLAHCPDYAETVKDYTVDLQLSGHNHGGQIQFPLIGPLITISGSKKYREDGLYDWVDNDMQLFINRGLGCSILPIRFLCRPRLSVLEFG